jgi:rhamnosyltransferase
MLDVNEILAIVVLYNSKLNGSKTILSLNKSLELSDNFLDVLVYDNSPFKMEERKDFLYKRLNIHYVHDSTNSGVSKAYNYGASYAKKISGKKWVLLLDQDTTFSTDLFFKYSEALKNNPDIKLFAPILMTANNIIFSPCRFYFGRGFPLKKVFAGLMTFHNISPVNSGMLIDLDEFFCAGMYNEAIKLDFSDFQFIERFKKKQSKFVIVDSVAQQDFSNNETDIHTLNKRYSFFCAGAKNFEKLNLFDDVKFLLVAFMRAVTLSCRTKSLIYFQTFAKFYLNSA